MLNCPNCGAPLNPYVWKCEYCGAYIFDLAACDFTDGKPTFVKFKTEVGTITALASPHLETVEISSEPVYTTDGYGYPIMTFHANKSCDINVRFSCMKNIKHKTLFEINMGD